MRKVVEPIVLLAAAGLLAGCQGSPLKGWNFARPKPASTLTSSTVSGPQVLEEGRAELREGKISAAAASFRLAMLDPATAADANNGLAVVYARLGRLDLAERYFTAAVALQPENSRFAANLLRLQFDRALRQPAVTQVASMATSDADRARERSAAARPHRVSDGFFHLRTIENLGPAPAMSVDYRRRVARIELPQPAAGEGAQPTADPGTPPASGPKPRLIVLNR